LFFRRPGDARIDKDL